MMGKIIIPLGLLLLFLAGSCEEYFGDYLEKPPGSDVTIDTIFSSRVEVETFIAGTYRDCMDNFVDMGHAATDEANCWVDYYWPDTWNKGALTPHNVEGINYSFSDFRWNFRWQGIRRTNILYKNIESVPGISQSYFEQVKGEARFLRALAYFETFKMYGGVPIVDHVIGLDEDYFIPRANIRDLINFMVSDCDEAASLLPDRYEDRYRGRATKGAALALKSRILLYAASPQFNTAEPYLDFGENNQLICYSDFDINRWKLAADAARDVINWAPEGGIHLIDDQGIDKNYKYVWEILDNDEIIIAEKKISIPSRYDQAPWTRITPTGILDSRGAVTTTFNWQKKYEKKDGTPQIWDPEGGDDLNQKYAELDPRFKQTIAYNGSYWNEDHPVVECFEGGASSEHCVGGAWMRKWIPDRLTESSPAMSNFIIFRLAEAYLNLAEAINEFEGPTSEAYDAVAIVRARSGMPPFPPGLSQEEFREKIRNERDVEFAYENHRLWDIRRWQIAEQEGVMVGNMWGIKINKVEGTDPQEFSYKPYVFEERFFKTAMYLHPFPQGEVNKGYLIQNPGY